MTCAICNGARASKNRKMQGLPVCPQCSQKMRDCRQMSGEQADNRGRLLVANLMCLVIARRGYENGRDTAALLWNVLEP